MGMPGIIILQTEIMSKIAILGQETTLLIGILKIDLISGIIDILNNSETIGTTRVGFNQITPISMKIGTEITALIEIISPLNATSTVINDSQIITHSATDSIINSKIIRAIQIHSETATIKGRTPTDLGDFQTLQT